jgi:hypothetical protein
VILRGPQIHGSSRIAYHDSNYASRIGWHEIVVGANAQSRSDELRAYPKDLLSSPLSVRSITAAVAPTSDPPPGLTHGKALQAPDRVADSGFASLIVHDHLSTGFVLLSLLIAMFWGAAHALSPGHGKSIVAALPRRLARHGPARGLPRDDGDRSPTRSASSRSAWSRSASPPFIVPDQLYPWLNLVSALLIVCVGLSVLRWRVREWRKGAPAPDHHHHHGTTTATRTAITTITTRPLSRRSLLGIGISGGSSRARQRSSFLLAAISLHRVGYGLVLIVAFSVGLAAAMTAIGILAVSAKRVFNRVDFNGGVIRFLPAVSAVVVLGLGLGDDRRAPSPTSPDVRPRHMGRALLRRGDAPRRLGDRDAARAAPRDRPGPPRGRDDADRLGPRPHQARAARLGVAWGLGPRGVAVRVRPADRPLQGVPARGRPAGRRGDGRRDDRRPSRS